MCGLLPRDFSRLTIREFGRLVRGALERQQRLEDLVATHLVWTVQPHVKERLAIDKVLGRPTLADRDQALQVRQRRGKEREA